MLLFLFFVKPILLLETACSRISTERFEGHSILFSDSITKLKEQMEWVDNSLELFNCLAEQAQFCKLSKAEIRDSLGSAIDQKVSHITVLARAEMLSAFGDHEDLLEVFKRFAATYSSAETKDDKK